MTAIRTFDHDGLLSGLREAEGTLDDYENSVVPLEHFDMMYEDPAPEDCKLCTKKIFPDDPTSLVNGDEVHRLCSLSYRIAQQDEEIKYLRSQIKSLWHHVT